MMEHGLSGKSGLKRIRNIGRVYKTSMERDGRNDGNFKFTTQSAKQADKAMAD
jgi:hypothetical protein